MDPALHAMLTGWLDSGEPVKVAHARHRLATLEPGYVPPPEPPPVPDRPAAREVMAVIRRAKLCPHYRPCETGCGGASCAHREHRITPWHDCRECLYLPG